MLSEDEEKFLKVLRDYSGIAETFNLEIELAWSPHKVAAVGRVLAKKGKITVSKGGGSIKDESRGKGSYYRIVEA